MSTELAIGLTVALALVWFLFKRAGESASLSPGASAGSVEEALARGRKIEAIKIYRQRHDVGLREAKQAVEELARTHALRSGS